VTERPIVRELHEGQLREADYWIAMREKVDMKRLIHEGVLEGVITESYKSSAILKSI